jgi:two-component system, chemotaxis family, response regulator Rcp1
MVHTLQSRGRPVRILLVEDNPSDALLVQKAFRHSRVPVDIQVARDGDMALDIMNRRPPFENNLLPDLVLLDLNIPKKNGIEVLSNVKSNEELQHIPVVVLTSSQSGKDIMKSYDLHANGYVVKPADLDYFAHVVQAFEHFWFSTVSLPDEATDKNCPAHGI